MAENQKLYEDAALGLVGRKVRIVFRVPITEPTKPADGIAYLHMSTNAPYIEIRPGLSKKRLEYVFLHECSHHYLGHARWSMACFKQTVSVKSTPDTKAERSNVNDQVEIWEKYAHENQNRYKGDDYERRLKAWAFWRFDEMITPIAERAGREAARKALGKAIIRIVG